AHQQSGPVQLGEGVLEFLHSDAPNKAIGRTVQEHNPALQNFDITVLSYITICETVSKMTVVNNSFTKQL
ncbi:MAG: hypothetical protein AAF848_16300, partial [Pseudomonadota bacterium]